MSRPKIARKGTPIDMTAMCDVAFLLLSFFILTAKFKPSDAVPVTTPNSVSYKIAPEKDVVLITINNKGKVFFSTGDNAEDKSRKRTIISSLNSSKNLGLTDNEISKLVKDPFIGVSLSQLKQQAGLPDEQINGTALPGIPAKDSTNNEVIDWMRAVTEAYAGIKPNILLKGDNASKYPVFKNVLTAFKKNELFKFAMVTNPQNVPVGSELYKQPAKKE